MEGSDGQMEMRLGGDDRAGDCVYSTGPGAVEDRFCFPFLAFGMGGGEVGVDGQKRVLEPRGIKSGL